VAECDVQDEKKKASRKRQFNVVTSTLHDNFAIVFFLIRVPLFVIAGDVKFPASGKLKLTHLRSNTFYVLRNNCDKRIRTNQCAVCTCVCVIIILDKVSSRTA